MALKNSGYKCSSLQFRASKINMALARMDKLVKKLMSNPDMTIHSPGLVEALQEKVAGLNCFNDLNLPLREMMW
jgi:hypothetical protein